MGECQWRGAAVADSRKGLTAQPTPSRRRQKPHRMQLISRVVRTRRSRPALPRSAAGTSLSWGPAQRICPSACRPFARALLAAAVRQTTALAPHHNSIPSQACPLGPALPLAPALPSAPAHDGLRKRKRPQLGSRLTPPAHNARRGVRGCCWCGSSHAPGSAGICPAPRPSADGRPLPLAASAALVRY